MTLFHVEHYFFFPLMYYTIFLESSPINIIWMEIFDHPILDVEHWRDNYEMTRYINGIVIKKTIQLFIWINGCILHFYKNLKICLAGNFWHPWHCMLKWPNSTNLNINFFWKVFYFLSKLKEDSIGLWAFLYCIVTYNWWCTSCNTTNHILQELWLYINS